MAGSTTWTFQQLTGALTTLQLVGWSAPFGRPRKEAIVNDDIEIRAAEVYYPGNETGPTRHIFGRKYPQRMLKGRFRDKAQGLGYASAKVLEVKAFVAAQQQVRITWSDQLSEVGFITKFEAGRESEGEIEWKLTYSCDSDDYDKKTVVIFNQSLPTDFGLAIYNDAIPILKPPLGVPMMQGSIFDALNSLLNLVNNALTDLYNLVSAIDSFEDASFGVLRRVLTMSAALSDNIFAVDEFFASQGVGDILFTQDAEASVNLWLVQTEVDIAIQQMLSDNADLQRQVTIALVGRPSTIYVARDGDTWESIAIQVYGAPDRAGDLYAANGNVAYPNVGQQCQVPQ